jgi:hypothetical protein
VRSGVLALTIICLFSSSALSRPHRHSVYNNGHIVGHPHGCPGYAFCGCGVSVRVFGHPVRNLYLASNWYRFHRTHPHHGAVAVWRHHVAFIENADGDGTAVVYDPNSGGHATRIHRISLAGAAIVDPR